MEPLDNPAMLYSALERAPSAHGTDAEGTPVYRFIARSSDKDRNGHTTNPAGWQLEAYHRNPVVLAGSHFAEWPIATAQVAIDADMLTATVTFGTTPDARETRQRVDDGTLRAISAGWIPLTYNIDRDDDGYPIGITSHTQELVELTLVAVPADRASVRIAAALEPRGDTLRDIRAALQALRETWT